MKTRDWKDVAELIGLVAIVASLVFVGLQMQQSQKIAQADRRNVRVANGLELAHMINAHADIWARGNAGEELESAEAIIFENLVGSMGAFRALGASAARLLGDEQGVRANETALALHLAKNPGAQRVWLSQSYELQKIRKELIAGYDMSPFLKVIQTDIERIEQLNWR